MRTLERRANKPAVAAVRVLPANCCCHIHLIKHMWRANDCSQFSTFSRTLFLWSAASRKTWNIQFNDVAVLLFSCYWCNSLAAWYYDGHWVAKASHQPKTENISAQTVPFQSDNEKQVFRWTSPPFCLFEYGPSRNAGSSAGCNNWRVLLMLRGGVVVWCDDLVTVRWVPSTGSSYSCPTTPTYPTVALQPDKQHTPTHLPPACLADQISLLTFSSLLARIYVNGTLCQTLETREDEVSWKSNLQIWRLSLFAEKENNWNRKPSIRGFNGNASHTTCFHNCTLILDWKVIF